MYIMPPRRRNPNPRLRNDATPGARLRTCNKNIPTLACSNMGREVRRSQGGANKDRNTKYRREALKRDVQGGRIKRAAVRARNRRRAGATIATRLGAVARGNASRRNTRRNTQPGRRRGPARAAKERQGYRGRTR